MTKNFANDQAPCYDRSNLMGTKLYYQSNRAGGGNYEIYSIDPTKDDTTAVVGRVTFSPGFDGYPASSLTGDLVFVTEFYGLPQLMLAHPSGTSWSFTRMTDDSATDTFPSVSPDGKWIAFMSDRNDSQMDIYRMPFDGGDPIRVTTDPSDDIDPYYGGVM